jgi:hypothetical protein
MKLIIQFCAITLILFTACKEGGKGSNERTSAAKEVTYTSFGSEISKEKAITSKEMLSKFESMIAGDTLSVKFASEIKEVILEGKAFVQITSVEELQHYAEDAGKNKEEIAAIVAPKKEFAFEATDVLLKK